jgi:acyl transferase domain-containing protein
LSVAAALYERGVSLSFSAMEGGRPRRKVRLPTYPFRRQRYWFDELLEHPFSEMKMDGAPVTLLELRDVFYDVRWDRKDLPALPDPNGN